MKILISILVGIGLFFILCDVFEIPFMKTSKAIKNLSKRQKKKSGSLEIWLDDLTDFIAKHIHMNEYKRIQLLSDLQSADMRTTPERHLAKALVKAGLCLLLAVPAFFIFPLITPLVVALAIAMYTFLIYQAKKSLVNLLVSGTQQTKYLPVCVKCWNRSQKALSRRRMVRDERQKTSACS